MGVVNLESNCVLEIERKVEKTEVAIDRLVNVAKLNGVGGRPPGPFGGRRALHGLGREINATRTEVEVVVGDLTLSALFVIWREAAITKAELKGILALSITSHIREVEILATALDSKHLPGHSRPRVSLLMSLDPIPRPEMPNLGVESIRQVTSPIAVQR
jgi:hypothetical protein